MNAEPRIRGVVAAELRRESKLESVPDSSTPEPGGLRDRLFLAFGRARGRKNADLIFSVQLTDGRQFLSNHELGSAFSASTLWTSGGRPLNRRTDLRSKISTNFGCTRGPTTSFAVCLVAALRLFRLGSGCQLLSHLWK